MCRDSIERNETHRLETPVRRGTAGCELAEALGLASTLPLPFGVCSHCPAGVTDVRRSKAWPSSGTVILAGRVVLHTETVNGR